MSDLYNSLARTFGPLVQIVYSSFILLLAVGCIGAAAFWCEQRFARAENRVLGILPFPILAIGILYGGLRFSGQLLYPADGWDQWGPWNYTNQNRGAFILFICGCLLTGAILAIREEKKRERQKG